jgi:hypothetical protein
MSSGTIARDEDSDRAPCRQSRICRAVFRETARRRCRGHGVIDSAGRTPSPVSGSGKSICQAVMRLVPQPGRTTVAA